MTDVSGVRVVANPSVPRWADGSVSLERVWSLRPEAGETSPTWQDPTIIRVAGSAIYVLDPMASRVHVFDLTGRYLASLGGPGHGPGELEGAFGMALSGDALVVGNGGSARLEIFDRNDRAYRGSIGLTGPAFHVGAVRPGEVIVRVLHVDTAAWRRVPLDGSESAGLTFVDTFATSGSDTGGCTATRMEPGMILRVNCLEPKIEIADDEGQAIQIIGIDRDARQADPADLSRFRRKVQESVAAVGYPPAAAREIIERQVETQRWVRSFRAADYSRGSGLLALWEQHPTELGGGEAYVHLFTDEGFYIARLEPGVPWIDFAFEGESLYALEADPTTGLATLVSYRLGMSARTREWLQRTSDERVTASAD